MNALPPSTESQNLIGVRAERIVQQFHLRRPAIVFLSALLAVIFLCIALGYMFSATHFRALVADNTSETKKVDAQLSALKTSLDKNADLQAANDAKRGGVLTRYVFGIPMMMVSSFPHVKAGPSGLEVHNDAMGKYKEYNDWLNETPKTDAQLKSQQSHLQRDIATFKPEQSRLAAERPGLVAALDSRCSARNWFGILGVAFASIAFISSRSRTTQTIYSVITAFGPSTQALTVDSMRDALTAGEPPPLSAPNGPNDNPPTA